MTTEDRSRTLRRSEADLCWFWNQAASDLGLSSSFGWMLRCLTERRSFQESVSADLIPDRRLEAARREREIRRRLSRCAPETQAILFAILGPPRQRRIPEYGKLTPLAWYVANHHWVELGQPGTSLEAWLAQVEKRATRGAPEARALITAIRSKAEKLYRQALAEFGGA